VEFGEIATTAILLTVLVVGVLIGRWHARRLASRILGARVTGLEREVERLAVEVARIDATAVLWAFPEMAVPDSPDGINA
jgi:hypothetical protein